MDDGGTTNATCVHIISCLMKAVRVAVLKQQPPNTSTPTIVRWQRLFLLLDIIATGRTKAPPIFF